MADVSRQRMRPEINQRFAETTNTLTDFAPETVVHADNAVERVEENLRHCRATSRNTVALWTTKTIAPCPDYRDSLKTNPIDSSPALISYSQQNTLAIH